MDSVMTVTTNATGRLGAFVACCAHESLPGVVMEKAAICLLDPLGLAVAARNERTAVAARAAAAHTASAENAARIWADGVRVGLTDADTPAMPQWRSRSRTAARCVAKHAKPRGH
jgi:2-methylcitrate dehydratase PrpD